MTEINWIDIQDRRPGDGREYLVATAKRERCIAVYKFVGGYWVANGLVVYNVTHYAPLLELPEPSKPKGPFGCRISGAGYWENAYHYKYWISCGEEEYEIPWPNETPIAGFIDWLNEIWNKTQKADGI